jgi:ABC-type multidrug transport system fused ATPase/permease subunit
VLYFIWKKRGFESNYNSLSRAMGYQDERRIRDVVNESLADGTLRVTKTHDKEYWRTTNKAEDAIGLFILPIAENVILVALGGVVLVAGLDGLVFGHRIPPQALTGLGVLVIASCVLFWLLQRRMERRIWQIERKSSGK